MVIREELVGLMWKKGEKNETSTHVPPHGFSHAHCLQLLLAESHLRARDAAALEITKP
jgi:site-specific recombinase XerC